MILTLIGLIFSFFGAFSLVFDAFVNFGKPKSVISVMYEGGGIKKIYRYDKLKDGFLKRVKITKEEKKLIVALLLLSLGFFLQILDFFI